MNIRYAAIWIGVVTLSVFGTDCTSVERSEPMKEDVVVADVVYTPSRHGSGMGVGPVMGSQGGMTVVVTSIDIPEVKAVVFQCKHGKFIIRDSELWERLKEGQEAVALYQEVYDVKRKGGEVKERKLVKYHLLNVLVDERPVLEKNR